MFGGRPLIVYGALAEAIRRESAEAVKYWFGVGQDTVWKWRKALGVGRLTEGTLALHFRWAPETVGSEDAIQGRMEANKSPERAAKISAAKMGNKPTPATIEKIRRANLRRKASAATLRKMSEAKKRQTVVTFGKAWTTTMLCSAPLRTRRLVSGQGERKAR